MQHEGAAAHFERLGEDFGCGFGQIDRALLDVVALDHDHELVAADAAQRAVVADRVGKTRGGHLQHDVAGVVAERVVDGLEVVEIDKENREPAQVGRVGDVVTQALQRRIAVAQAGQQIVFDQMRHLALAAEQLADQTGGHGKEAEHGERDETRHQQIDVARVVVVGELFGLRETNQHAERITVDVPVREDARDVVDRIDIGARHVFGSRIGAAGGEFAAGGFGVAGAAREHGAVVGHHGDHAVAADRRVVVEIARKVARVFGDHHDARKRAVRVIQPARHLQRPLSRHTAEHRLADVEVVVVLVLVHLEVIAVRQVDLLGILFGCV